MARQLVVVDASVVLKWFHAAGEEAVEPARTILDAFARRQVDLVVLDLTIYEIGNVLVRAGAGARAAATILAAVLEICEPVALSGHEMETAARLAGEHHLTFHDAAYAAVAHERRGRLVTLSRALLKANLGVRPEDAFA